MSLTLHRYDIRLLLNHLPTKQPHRSPSPSGWSDLPSDSEDTFFLSQDDIEDYRREKRRRLHEAQREERLKARMEQDGEEVWGGSDEEVHSLFLFLCQSNCYSPMIPKTNSCAVPPSS